MPIYQHLSYEPEIREIKTEADIIKLLRDVKKELGKTDWEVEPSSLSKILGIVEGGRYINKNSGREGIADEIDLSGARALVNQYRSLSEKGCQSCQHVRETDYMGETYRYCKLFEADKGEKKDFCLESRWSERVQKYSEKGCEKRNPVFRKLEEVLAEAENRGER